VSTSAPAATRSIGASRARASLAGPWLALRAAIRSAIFVAKLMPMRRSPADLVTRSPQIHRVSIPTAAGPVEASVYRPRSRGPHPGVLATFGIVPPGVVDPRIAQMGEAFARAGFAALLYCSPSAGDLRLERGDVAELVDAYDFFLHEPYVDASLSGFSGVCIGSAYALMAAADPRIRDRVRFVFAYAPYSSMWSLAVDIASGTRDLGDVREPWEVDPLTWKVYVRSVTGWLPARDAECLRRAFEGRIAWDASKTMVLRSPAGEVDLGALTPDGRAAWRLLHADSSDVDAALRALPPAAKALLASMSPITYVRDIAAKRIVLLHDRHDHVIPVGESRRLFAALRGRPGVTYTETGLRHLRMPKGISPIRVLREIARSYAGWYPLFRETTR
jgi:dienelactone hydrolase